MTSAPARPGAGDRQANVILIMSKKAEFCLGAVLLCLVQGASLAKGLESWVEHFACGEASYKVTSSCKASGAPETLNTCRSQDLEITRAGNTKKSRLPQLSKSVATTIKDAGGTVHDLFLVKQACTRIDGAPVEVFYYSIGGGSAPDAEAWSVYDATGTLLEENDPRFGKAVAHPFERMKPVRSIMPR